MLDVEGFILVGGASSRMGTDKACLPFGEKTGVDRIAGELRVITDRIALVGTNDGVSPGFKIVRDLHPNWGALGGIHAALNSCEAPWAIIVACDLPFVTRQLLSCLAEFAGADTDAAVPIQGDGRPQPLCALYAKNVCLKETERLIAAGEHAPRALLANVRTRWIESRELAGLPGAEHFFFNMNTPADYERAKRMIDGLRNGSAV